MSDSPVNLTPAGPPDTVLPAPDPEAAAALATAMASEDPKSAIAAVVADNPRYLDAWARLGIAADDAIEAYAYFRIGYHRGLDALRASGWRGSGFVRWSQESNRGFLRALAGLRASAAQIGEEDEVERISQFLKQLDPQWPPGGGWSAV
jgi:hypothetical protein